MAAVLVEYLPDGKEPVSVDEVKHNSRIDGDAEDQFIETVLIPAARQLAETRAGAAIRPARYRDLLPSLASFPLSLSQVREIDSIVVDGAEIPQNAYSLIELGKQTLIDVPGYRGSGGLVTYQAGIEDMNAYPSVKSWILLAAGWLYENRDMAAELPAGFLAVFLTPISQPPRF
ncbi:head-tail connector protein [Bordetella bronchiseptica]|uniref:head-tail connector protein n=1 Tax=Bordetella bronchiseptica TaxID=518 RepID=UPI000F6B43B0|nr:head-tail connector protein [Bordetella bronchiseptica]VEI25167.1 Uncharacterised protein [Bordetella bronchiseptica]